MQTWSDSDDKLADVPVASSGLPTTRNHDRPMQLIGRCVNRAPTFYAVVVIFGAYDSKPPANQLSVHWRRQRLRKAAVGAVCTCIGLQERSKSER